MCDHKQEYNDIKKSISRMHEELHDMTSVLLAVDKMHNEYEEIASSINELKKNLELKIKDIEKNIEIQRMTFNQWMEVVSKDLEERLSIIEDNHGSN